MEHEINDASSCATSSVQRSDSSGKLKCGQEQNNEGGNFIELPRLCSRKQQESPDQRLLEDS